MQGKKTFVVSLGGSVFAAGGARGKKGAAVDKAFLRNFSGLVESLRKKGFRFVVVTGGGAAARERIAQAEKRGAGNFEKDLIGIECTRANARKLIKALPSASAKVQTDARSAKALLAKGKIPVYGGLIPSFTTDAIASLIAESIGGIFVNMSNVKGIFTADPRKNKNARLIRRMSHDALVVKMSGAASKPGQHVIIDLPAALILRRSKIPAYVILGRDLENFRNVVLGKEFIGTRIF